LANQDLKSSSWQRGRNRWDGNRVSILRKLLHLALLTAKQANLGQRR